LEYVLYIYSRTKVGNFFVREYITVEREKVTMNYAEDSELENRKVYKYEQFS